MPSVRAKKTHADYCLSVCFLCFCRSKDMRKINSKQWETIEKYLVSGLNREDERLPKVLCSTCRLAVSEYARGIFDRDINSLLTILFYYITYLYMFFYKLLLIGV